jgi:hypothetical protein
MQALDKVHFMRKLPNFSCFTSEYSHIPQRGFIVNKERHPFLSVPPSLKMIVVTLLMLLIVACHTGTSLSTDTHTTARELEEEQNPYAKADITTKIIPSVNSTFGYDIFIYGKTLVHQPNMPGLPGNEGFTTQEKAQTVADFVVKKIKNNEMPPTVTIDDLNIMRVLR